MMHKWMSSGALPNLQGVVRIGQTDHKEYNVGLHTYEDLLLGHKTGTMDPDADETSILLQAEKVVKPDDVVNFEFTSGQRLNAICQFINLTHAQALLENLKQRH
jgi:hypothetical protein